MKNRVGVSTNTYHGFNLDQALEGVSKAGFKYVELTGVAGWTEHVRSEMDLGELDNVKALLRKYDLEVIALSGHCNLMDPGQLDNFKQNIKLAGKLGCEFIVSSTGEAHNSTNHDTQDEQLVENLNKLLPLCRESGVKLVLEIHGEHSTGAQLKKIVEMVGSEDLRINYDTANVVFYGKSLPDKDIVDCVEYVDYVHLKDKGGAPDEWNFPALGKGWLKLEETLRYLDSQNYSGPLSVEIEFTQDFTMNEKKPGDLEIVNEAVKESFTYLKKLGYV